MKILKIGKSSKFVVECNWSSRTSQKVQFFGYFRKKMDFWKKNFNSLIFAKYRMFFVGCDRNGKKSQNVHNLIFLQRKNWFFRKKLDSSKDAICSNQSGESYQISKTSQNFQKLGFFPKIQMGLLKTDMNVM